MDRSQDQPTSTGLLARLLPRWLLSLVVVLISALIFLDLAEDVWLKEGFTWDAPLMRAVHRLSAPWLDLIMKGVSQTASGTALVLAALLAIWFWRLRQQRLEAVTIAAAVVGAATLNLLLKEIFARPRPDIFPPLTVVHSYSFPSGHTSTAAAFYGLLAILLWRAHYRGAALLSGVWVLVVAFSRVYLGVHYPSDVLASMVLGIIWLYAVILVYDRYRNKMRRLAE